MRMNMKLTCFIYFYLSEAFDHRKSSETSMEKCLATAGVDASATQRPEDQVRGQQAPSIIWSTEFLIDPCLMKDEKKMKEMLRAWAKGVAADIALNNL